MLEPNLYEYTKTIPSTGRDLALGTPTNLITAQIIDSGDSVHHQVLDITYNHAAYNGGVHFAAPTPGSFDLSSYASGSLQFDLKVIDRGDAQTTVNYKVVCGWPCESTEIRVTPTQLNQWQTISIPISDLVMRGLDLTKASTAIELLPTWDAQAGVHFQVDNIRWIKDTHPITSTKCFGQHSFTNVSLRLESLDSMTTDFSQWLTAYEQLSITPDWIAPTQSWGMVIGNETNIPSCIENAILSADVFIPKTYVDDGSMLVGLYATDASGNKIFFGTTSVAGLKADDWNHLSKNLTGVSNLGAMRFLGVAVYANGKPSNISGKILVDNIVLSHAVGASSVSSSSSSSSTGSVSTASCNLNNGAIYMDGLCQNVGNIGIYKQSTNSITQVTGNSATVGNVSLYLKSEDLDRPHIMHIMYGVDAQANGQVTLEQAVNTTVNLSAYTSGKLEFELKVYDYGNASGFADRDDKLHFTADCGWPCGTVDMTVRPTLTKQWQTMSISAADMMLSGLDLSKIHTLFQVFPAWNKQLGANYKIANVRWVANGGATPPDICYGKYFRGESTVIESQVLDNGGGTAIKMGSNFQNLALAGFNWGTSSRIFGLGIPADTTLASCAYSGNFHYQMYLPASYVLDGKMKVGIMYTDTSGKHAYMPATSAAGLRGNEWNSISIPLSAAPFTRMDAGFNGANLAYYGVYLDANGKDPAIKGDILIDNFIITH